MLNVKKKHRRLSRVHTLKTLHFSQLTTKWQTTWKRYVPVVHSCVFSLVFAHWPMFVLWMKMTRTKKNYCCCSFFPLQSLFHKFFERTSNNTIIGTFVLLFSSEVLYVPCRTLFATNNVIHKDSCNVSRLRIMNILLFVFSKRKCEYNANIWHERHTIKIPKIDYRDDCLNRFRMSVRICAKRHSWNDVCFSFDAFHGPNCGNCFNWLLLVCKNEHDAVKFAFFVAFVVFLFVDEKSNVWASNCALKEIVILR